MPTICDEDPRGLGDRWHLDEVFLKINGRIHYLRCAVDQDGEVLDILVQSRRDKKAAKKFFRKLLKGCDISLVDTVRLMLKMYGGSCCIVRTYFLARKIY